MSSDLPVSTFKANAFLSHAFGDFLIIPYPQRLQRTAFEILLARDYDFSIMSCIIIGRSWLSKWRPKPILLTNNQFDSIVSVESITLKEALLIYVYAKYQKFH